ncbi:SAVED domain-containing protein [Streptomyces sp. DSM 44918]|uniref:SAVED domain-containing protein n=1 Tax=Streptomyces millisiae TaxID=3075542 RepID=A0ABU2LKB4_9ACTN|nr:SAVED domain-containing protein [Streptomyces sp. DSM 44918]MDT0318024.1 SAVED domain-containing protein [Streptomyces sp. DSM 44918]
MDHRESADNLMLVCADDHAEFDAPGALDVYTVSTLRELKRSHEDRIRHLTGLSEDRATTVLRMVGQVHGREVELSREAAMTAVVAAKRYPLFLESYSRHGIEIDLRHVLGESAGPTDMMSDPGERSHSYFRNATALIDDVIERQLKHGIVTNAVRHLSVFGFARLPLLVYLGSRLDDTVPTEIHQRQRHDESWCWQETAPVVDFTTRLDHAAPHDREEVVVLSISGTVNPEEIPAELRGLRRYQISPAGVPSAPDIIAHQGTLRNFIACVRSFLADLDAAPKTIRRLHVLPALPLSAAISLGRLHHQQVHPELAIYERLDGRYWRTLDITLSAGETKVGAARRPSFRSTGGIGGRVHHARGVARRGVYRRPGPP